jgi:DNA-binding transcriptional regulator YiaG
MKDNEKLKEARVDLGLTQKKIAETFNTPFGTYMKWENGQRRVPGIVWPLIKFLKKDSNNDQG